MTFGGPPSALDPAAAGGAGGAAALDALVTAELSALAADGQALQQQVAIGDILAATVLPSNGLGDLLDIRGNRVAASLPPTLTPGDRIAVQVTGFDGPRILLQLVGADGAPPGPAAPGPAAPGPAAAPAPALPPVATPPAASVASSVRPNAPVPPPIPPGAAFPEGLTDGRPGTIPGAAGTAPVVPVFGSIEGRLAAARAAALRVAAPGAPEGPPPAPESAPLPLGGRAFVVPPQIASSPYAGPAAAPGASAGTAAAQAPPPARSAAAFQEPLALVRALNLPVTPPNIAAAKLALDSPQRLPVALATLERALPSGNDPQIATLRTLLAFVGKIEPSSPQLAAQIAAYVDHVVGGSEPALAQLLAAHAAESPPAASPPAATEGPLPADAQADGTPAAPAAPGAPTAPSTPALPVVAFAQLAERAASLAAGLKAQLFALAARPPVSGRESDGILPAAATAALTAATSVQLAAAQAAAANPQTLSFSLPMWLGAGYGQALISVDRDAPDAPNVPVDGDNFHIAFVLDTKHLGTVAIDLRTVGRAFSLSVKAENLRTAQRFGDELSRLTDRLSTLRYQPKLVESVVAAPTAGRENPVPSAVPAVAPVAAAAAGVNERA